MALIKCGECGKEISDKADTCPNCGCPNIKKTNEEKSILQFEENVLNQNKSNTKSSIIGGGIAAVIISIFLLFLAIQGGFKEKINVKGDTMYEYLTILEKYGQDIDLDGITAGANCYTGTQTKKIDSKKYGKVTVEFSYCKSSDSVYIHIYN